MADDLDAAEDIAILRAALAGEGSFSLGAVPLERAELLGIAWVGPGWSLRSDQRTLLGADGRLLAVLA